LTFST